jgi:hypothetical protein
VDSSKSPKEIDLIANGKPVGRGVYEFVGGGAAGGPPPELRIAISQDGKRPAKIERRGRDGVIAFELSRPDPKGNVTALDEKYDLLAAARARDEVERQRAALDAVNAKLAAEVAEANALKARQQVLLSQVQLDEAMDRAAQASAQLKRAQADLKAHEERAAALKKGQGNAVVKPGTFTLHIRTPLAAEKVGWTQLTGSDTVLDVIGKSADASKVAPTASLWIVRGGKVLSIDWSGITKNGVTATNYPIMNGDQLFVQVNVGK